MVNRLTPAQSADISKLEVRQQPNYTYEMLWDKKRIVGHISENDGINAVRQAAKKILLTERYIHVIYDWDYGTQTDDLFGMPRLYFETEYKRRSKEALLRDDRIRDVTGYEFEWVDDACRVTMQIITVFGNFEQIADVYING